MPVHFLDPAMYILRRERIGGQEQKELGRGERQSTHAHVMYMTCTMDMDMDMDMSFDPLRVRDARGPLHGVNLG